MLLEMGSFPAPRRSSVGRGRRLTEASPCLDVCTGSEQALQAMASSPSGSCEGENLRMCVQMAQPEPHCQGLGVRSPEAGSGRQQTGSGVKSNRTPKGPGTTEAPGVCVSTGQMSQVCVERGMKSGQVPRDPDVKWGCVGRVTPVSPWVAPVQPCRLPLLVPVLSVHHSATDCAPWLDMEG